MSKIKREIIIKTLLVITWIFMLFLFPGLPILSFFISEQILNTLFYVDLVLTFVFGITFMILLPIFGLKQKPIMAEKIPLLFDKFDSLLTFLKNSAAKENYKEQPTLSFDEQETVTIFVRPHMLWKLDCVALVRTKELTDDILHMANDKVTESLKAYYGTERITDTVSMISIVCVDRITPAFQKLVNSNIQQGFKNLRLPVGISFGGKSIYIAKQKDGFAITKYKKLRKEFFKIMQIPDRK